jgi:hypothetical protein
VPQAIRKHAVCVLVAAALLAVVSRGSASAQLDEANVKAAMIINVALFVDWPAAAANERFVIGVAADETFVKTVATTARGKRLHEREIQVQRLADSEEGCACQVLFVGELDDRRSTTLLRRARGTAALTIGETTSFLREGGMVRIFREEDRLRLQINAKNAESAGLRISSRLLQLAAKP